MTSRPAPDPFAALGDPTRRAVLEALRGGPRSVGAVAAGLPVSRPAVSQHLKILKAAGLVTERAEGARRLYAIDARGLSALQDWLDGVWGDALARFKAHAESRSPEEDRS